MPSLLPIGKPSRSGFRSLANSFAWAEPMIIGVKRPLSSKKFFGLYAANHRTPLPKRSSLFHRRPPFSMIPMELGSNNRLVLMAVTVVISMIVVVIASFTVLMTLGVLLHLAMDFRHIKRLNLINEIR